MTEPALSRRALLALAAASPLFAGSRRAPKSIPVGLELYSVRGDLKNDLFGTLRSVAALGYQCCEFFSPYYQWTPDYARQVSAVLKQAGIPCHSTHNDLHAVSPEGVRKAIELNQILGTKYIVLAHPGNVKTLDDWKRIIDTLNTLHNTLKPEGLHAGYHNHDLEWLPVDGQKPIEMIAAGTDPGIMLQLDVGTCLSTGNDPVAWINRNPGRIRSLHLKDWSPENGYRVLFGEGAAPWKAILQAARATGGAEYLLIEQEGSRYPEMQTAQLCLQNYRKLTASMAANPQLTAGKPRARHT